MKREEISLIAQLLASMKDAIDRMDEGYKKKDEEMVFNAKREILKFQSEIKRLLYD